VSSPAEPEPGADEIVVDVLASLVLPYTKDALARGLPCCCAVAPDTIHPYGPHRRGQRIR
jgi:hypothetical protein